MCSELPAQFLVALNIGEKVIGEKVESSCTPEWAFEAQESSSSLSAITWMRGPFVGRLSGNPAFSHRCAVLTPLPK
jgi:hypothetical protein